MSDPVDTLTDDAATAPPRLPTNSWGAAVVHLAAGVSTILSKGERREIQTMRWDRWDTGLVWKCLHHFVFPHQPELNLNRDQVDANEQRWAALIIAMSWCPHSHSQGALRFGSALGRSQYQEPRFIALTRCEGHDLALYDRFIHATRYLGQRDTPLDWRNASLVLFTIDQEKRERLRRDLARDYYREQHLGR